MITIKADAEIKIEHPGNLAVAESGRIVAASREGFATILNSDLSSRVLFVIPEGITGLSISSTGALVAAAQGPATRPLGVGDLGKLIIIAPSTGETIHETEGSYNACRFFPPGELWSVVALDAFTLAIEVRETTSWQLMARTEMRDPFGDSTVDLIVHPDGTHMAVYSAGGQDGQCFAWARRDGSSIHLAEDPIPNLNYTSPPSFNAAGDRFLVVADENLIREYQFPDGLLLREFAFEITDGPLYQVEYAGPDLAIVNESMEAFHLVDLGKGEIDKIQIDAEDPGEADSFYFVRNSGAGFASVHGKLPIRQDVNRPTRILTWRISGSRK